ESLAQPTSARSASAVASALDLSRLGARIRCKSCSAIPPQTIPCSHRPWGTDSPTRGARMRHLARVQSASSAQGGAEGGEELTRFCTQCGSLFDAPAGTAERPNRGRVCSRCGLGMVLTCAAETLSAPGSASLLVPAALRVRAARHPAEKPFAEPAGH